MTDREDRDRRTLLVAVLLVVLVVVGALTVVTLVQQDRLNHNTHRLDVAQVGFCNRLQILRDAVNLHSYVDYHKAQLHHRDGAAYFYEPPTNCAEANRAPESFRPPARVPFWTVACRFVPPDHLRPAVTPTCSDKPPPGQP